MENFFQTNVVWFIIGAIILGVILVIKSFFIGKRINDEEKYAVEELCIGAFVLTLVSLFFFLTSVLSVINDQGWEVTRARYLFGAVFLFISYVFHGLTLKVLDSSNQELKDSQRNLKEEIKRQKKKIKIS